MLDAKLIGSTTNWSKALLNSVMLSLCVLMLAGCSGSSPGAAANVSSLRQVTGNNLAGARGKTRQDQQKIDQTVAGLCGAAVFNQAECDAHTEASARRLRELPG